MGRLVFDSCLQGVPLSSPAAHQCLPPRWSQIILATQECPIVTKTACR